MSSFICSLCPGGIIPSNPYATVYLGDQETDCETMAIAARAYDDEPTTCSLIQREYGEICGCDTLCSSLSFDSCSGCVNAGCSWCPTDAMCLSTNYIGSVSASCSAEEWVVAGTAATCPTTTSSLWNDPLYDNDSWAYNLMNLDPVWSQGITGSGVHIRVNDNGVDPTHPEFQGKFDFEASCAVYAPLGDGGDSDHGTSTASIAAGNGNNNECSVGVAPGATISSCTIIAGGTGTADSTAEEDYLTVGIDKVDISTNSYGALGCSSIGERRRHNRRLQECPFRTGTGSPCNVCDFTQEPLSTICTNAIFKKCLDPVGYESDATACVQYLEVFATCHFNDFPSSQMLDGMVRGVTEGRNGKGIVFLWAVGNERHHGSDANFDWQTSTRYTISVAGVDKSGLHASYSNPGSSVFVSAPGGDMEYATNWVAAKSGGGCHDATAGTSFACPAAAGVVALILDVNPNLGWRDVQGVLATTSQKVDPSDPLWTTNGAGLSHSNYYGFGLVDASAAVAAARGWVNYGAERSSTAESGEVNLPVGWNPTASTASPITIAQDIVVESVVVYIDLIHTSRGHLEITLTSPSGTRSVLAPGQRPENTQLPSNAPWHLMTVANWGESSAGQWTLALTDIEEGDLSACVDLPEIFDVGNVTDAVLTCKDVERISDIIEGLEDDIFLSDDFNPCDDAQISRVCCFCGGGRDSSTLQNMLVSWRLIVYGHDETEGTTDGTTDGTTAGEVPGQVPDQVQDQVPAPTEEDGSCPNETDAAASCLEGIENGNNCLDCVFGYWPEPLQSCTDIDDETCIALDACACGSCGDEIIAWAECATSCSISCPSIIVEDISGGDDAAPAPTVNGDDAICWGTKDDYEDCLAREVTQAQASDCNACVDKEMSMIFEKEYLSCSLFEDDVCNTLKTCESTGCGVCTNPISKWLDCMVDDDPNFPLQGCQIQCLNLSSPNSDNGSSNPSDPNSSSASSSSSVIIRSSNTGGKMLLLASVMTMLSLLLSSFYYSVC